MLGKKSVHAEECFAGHFIAAGFIHNRDLTGKLPDDWREFNKIFIPVWLAKHPGKSKIAAGLACGFLWTVTKGIKKRDIVLCPDGNGRYHVGIVAGDYFYVGDDKLPHHRPVQWLPQIIYRADMSEALRNSVGSSGTVSNISDYRDEIKKLIGDIHSTALISKGEMFEDPAAIASKKHLEDFLVQNGSHGDVGNENDNPDRVDHLAKEIISVRKLLAEPGLAIPQYQRPYKWTSKNINQLFSDIATNKDKSSYRLGTIVFHQDGEQKNIVDGQQRTISLLLAIRALITLRKDELDRKDLKEQLGALEQAMMNPSFESEVSKVNIHNNYLEVSRIVSRSDFTEELIDFLLNKCEVVTFALNDVSEAFQFFDSQNARGRDLEPHDLLKAYHLREFSKGDEPLKSETVARWENSETEELVSLFSQYLYRIRNWSKGASARYFGKDDTALFKGVNIETVAHYPYVEQLRMAHHFVDHYNHQFERRIDGRPLTFPFHLDQIIINGRRFFEMTAHYQDKVARFNDRSAPILKFVGNDTLDGFAARIMETINSYPGRSRTGDRYVRTIFDCLLIYYIDKFGYVEISRAIEKVFIWAYSLRLKMQVVQLASMDNHALENNLFRQIKESTRPSDFINCNLPVITENRSSKAGEIEALFKDMRYYE